MPHYYFDIKDGHTLVDPSGLNFKTDSDAIARAEAIAIVVSRPWSIRNGTFPF
jgi:hypothetical protein